MRWLHQRHTLKAFRGYVENWHLLLRIGPKNLTDNLLINGWALHIQATESGDFGLSLEIVWIPYLVTGGSLYQEFSIATLWNPISDYR
jgi:hypothetical protein